MGILINFIKKIFGVPEPSSKKSIPLKKKQVHASKPSTDSYLLEYRHSGYPRDYILDHYFELKRAYKITHPAYHYVPHITIAGPIITSHETKLIQNIQEIIFRNAPNFHEPGNLVGTGKFITFDTEVGGQVLAIEVKPPQSLVNLKKEIESNLNTIDDFKFQKYQEEIWHTTLWNMKKNVHEDKEKFQKVWRNLKNSPQEMKFILDRITLIKNGIILNEFDLVDFKSYNRMESLDNSARYKSYLKLKAELESKGESFEFSNKNTGHNEIIGGEEDIDENSTEIQDGTIQAEWNY